MILYDITPEDLVKDGNSFSLRFTAEKLKICSRIMDNFETTAVQAVLEYQGNRTTEYGSTYYNLIFNIITSCSSWDSGSSSTTHDMAKFVSDFILIYAANKKTAIIQLKKDKIKKMQEEIKELETELSNTGCENCP